MKRVLLVLALVAVFALVACATPTPEPTKAPPTAAPTPVPPTATKPPEPTKAPTVPPTAPPASSSASAAPTVAPTAAGPKPAILTLTLRKGAKWSDGTPFTAKEVVGTWDILWLQSSSSWNFLNDVVAKDDVTVEFNIKTPGPAILDTIIRSTIT